MYITFETIVLIGSALGVLGTMIGVILKVHKWYLRIEALEKRCDELERHHKEDIERVNAENTMICYALSACLNGLQQLGANGDVTIAKDKLDKFLNQQAHH